MSWNFLFLGQVLHCAYAVIQLALTYSNLLASLTSFYGNSARTYYKTSFCYVLIVQIKILNIKNTPDIVLEFPLSRASASLRICCRSACPHFFELVSFANFVLRKFRSNLLQNFVLLRSHRAD